MRDERIVYHMSKNTTPAQSPSELQFLLDSLYDINEDATFVSVDDDDDYYDYVEDEDGSEAYARMLERRAEAGSWFGREDY